MFLGFEFLGLDEWHAASSRPVHLAAADWKR
jgi:hypothetical protein